MERDIVHPDLVSYLDGLLPPRPAVVEEMEAEAERRGFPIVGPHVGRLLGILARAARAKRVFELGSGFGYSTYWFAEAVGEGGEVVHTDSSAENTAAARDWLGRLGLGARVRCETGDALEVLRRESGPYDLVFCDIDKVDYPEVPDVALPRLCEGGLLVFDNTLWYGRVADREGVDRDTEAIRRLNRDLFRRDDLLTVILPLRDGVSVSLKRANR